MKNRFKLGAAASGALALTLWWAFGQGPPPALETLVPAGPLLYMEARDLGALLRSWDQSAEKQAWLDSANYTVFSRSRLLRKLADAQADFAGAAGVPPDYAMLSSVAGSNSALAIYDIGRLEFLFLTRLPSARALNTDLWRARGTYQTRRAGNTDYYVKTGGAAQRTAAFAYTNDLLLLATQESALAGALELIARVNRPAVASEPWFTSAVTAVEPGNRDLRLVYNMERLAASYPFRSYWVQHNIRALNEFRSGAADPELAAGEIRERRILLRASGSEDSKSVRTGNNAWADSSSLRPGTARKITARDLPGPGQAPPSRDRPVARPAHAWPQAPQGFALR
jgi:hypothetical protein